MLLRILFIGDIVGKLARKVLAQELLGIKKTHKIDLVIANAENAAHGIGISKKIYEELVACGIDFMTLGDHAFDKPEIEEVLGKESANIIRPENFSRNSPGKGHAVIEIGSKKILIIDLIGRVFMKMNYDCPFYALDGILEKYKQEKFAGIIVDFHAEATSEKLAFGWYADGRVSAICGTHTHVPTADARILPKGTAFVSDVGMAGPKHSVIGRKIETTLPMFLQQKNQPYEPMEEGICVINSVIIDIDADNGTAKSIKRLDKEISI